MMPINSKKRKLRWVGLTAAVWMLISMLASCDTAAFLQAAAAGPTNSGTSTELRDGTLACYFPRAGEPAKPELLQVIRSAEKSLDIAIYSVTDGDFADEVLQAQERGVSVRMITDRSQAGGEYQKPQLQKIKKAGIPVKIDSHSGIMHLKVTLADQKIVTTGSYNYTKSAEEKNDEVFVVIRDEKIAERFEQEFEAMWNDSKHYEEY